MNRKLTPEQVAEIRRRRGCTPRPTLHELAAEFGVSPSSISLTARGLRNRNGIRKPRQVAVLFVTMMFAGSAQGEVIKWAGTSYTIARTDPAPACAVALDEPAPDDGHYACPVGLEIPVTPDVTLRCLGDLDVNGDGWIGWTDRSWDHFAIWIRHIGQRVVCHQVVP